jgi:3-deoxy-D-manno-octulosonic acid (KDO) 8-phosphate synthase
MDTLLIGVMVTTGVNHTVQLGDGVSTDAGGNRVVFSILGRSTYFILVI